ncbi:uncharacterized protein LOC106663231 isoform X2 [Cimex lectularius]|uniref:Uncharacterized protein n=1 Tax=Cimex lectularius TaxID=79782 RepID=A0A8I6RCN0_CIMLE|nr:uncharacterized protein LOC106663231 isoform X2 [Cimex lectularius]
MRVEVAPVLFFHGRPEVAEEFLDVFHQNHEEGTADFVELLFHAGGWSTFVYLGGTFPQKQQFVEIKANATHDLFAPVANREIDFQRRFSEFLSIVLESNKCCLMYNDQFMSVVIRAYQILSAGKWDMFRLIAQILGMKMLCSLNKEYEKLKTNYISDISNPMTLSRIHRNTLYQGWQQSFFKIYHLVQFFVYKTLCEKCQGQGTADIVASPFCRLTNLLNELMISTTLPPTPMFKDRWLTLILNGLRDKNYDHKGLCYMVLYLLLCRPEDPRWQMRLFDFVKSDLLYSLRMYTDLSLISLRILSSVAKCTRIDLNGFELETIYYYLYNPDQSLAILAAELVFEFHMRQSQDGFLIIKNLIKVCRNSFMRCDELLMDSIYDNIKDIVTWESWTDFLKDCVEEDVHDVMALLYAYARKMTTGFIPRFRTTIIREMSPEEVTENRRTFTDHFLKDWFCLLELGKLTVRPKSLAKLIKLPQYFDEAIISKENDAMTDVAKVCLAYITLGHEHTLIEECCRTLSKMSEFSRHNPDVCQEVNLIISATTKVVFKDFKKFKTDLMTQCQILSATKFLEVDDLILWEVSMEKLSVASAQRMNQNLIKTLILMLFQLLMKRAKCVINELCETKTCNLGMVNVLVSNCMSRSIALNSVIRAFLAPSFGPDVRKVAFMTMLDLLEFLGPHMTLPEGIWFSKTAFDDEDVYKLVSYTTEMIENSNSCQTNHITSAKLKDCCSVLYKLCMFISKGILDVQCLTPLMRHLGKNPIHDDIIVEAINKFTSMFPHKWELLSNAIFNTYAIIKDDCLPNDLPLQDTAEVREMMSKLFTELSVLTQVLTRRLRFSDPRTLRKVSIRLHTVLIDQALKPTGFRSCIDLLYAIRDLLANEDVQFILSCLDEYHIEFSADVAKYYNFLKQSISPTPTFLSERDNLQLLAAYPIS